MFRIGSSINNANRSRCSPVSTLFFLSVQLLLTTSKKIECHFSFRYQSSFCIPRYIQTLKKSHYRYVLIATETLFLSLPNVICEKNELAKVSYSDLPKTSPTTPRKCFNFYTQVTSSTRFPLEYRPRNLIGLQINLLMKWIQPYILWRGYVYTSQHLQIVGITKKKFWFILIYLWTI